jgi:dolichol-phosphate mannosyltransferase
MPKNLVICPVHNEAPYLGSFLKTTRTHYAGDLLFVDDGSTDRSASLIEQACDAQTHLVRHSRRSGYGAALLSGFAFALKQHYDNIITIDADMQHDPRHLPDFLRQLQDHDVVLGSRYLQPKYIDNIPRERFLINRNILWVINTLFQAQLTDPFCGYRGYRTRFLQTCQLTETSYGFALEILLEALLHKRSIKEVAIEVIYLDRARVFLDGLDDAHKRFYYYLNIVKRKHKEYLDHEKNNVPYYRCPSG